MERAKELFLKYSGNRFYMDLDGEGSEYDSYHVSKETEAMWAEEHISRFLESKMQGKEALRAYSAVTELLKSDRRNAKWDRCLYYPLRAGHLDDVTILFMLPAGFRLAEKAAKKTSVFQERSGRVSSGAGLLYPAGSDPCGKRDNNAGRRL